MQNSEVQCQQLPGKYGLLGLIMLNRPDALNALTENMCIRIYEQLDAWQKMEKIQAIIIQGAGDKAFCAGGDIRTLYNNRGKNAKENSFFKNEYRLNTFIYHYPKPYIALMNGLTMGGGAGVSVNGRYRIGTEKLKFAMPETGIGFFPDVGGSYFLSHCPHKIGWYLGLTGNMIEVADAIYAGLVDRQIDSKKITDFCERLTDINWQAQGSVDELTQIINDCHVVTAPSPLAAHLDNINQCFSAGSIEAILLNLKNDPSEWAKQTYEVLLKRSPTSLKITFQALQRGEKLNFDDCIKMEYVIAGQILQGHDFYEGVRAALVDKDKNPQWRPAELSQVTDRDVAVYFKGLDD